MVGIEQQAQEDLDRRGAEAAIELDGYKRVSIMGKTSNGAWRAKGYRGTAEVLLTVAVQTEYPLTEKFASMPLLWPWADIW